MNVVAISTVKNEADIIEAMVRHNLAFVDRMVVLDNGSTDSTLDILHRLEKERLPLDVVVDRSLGKFQSRRMTWLMREHAVRRCRADWVLPLDADEFVSLPEDGQLIPPDAEGSRPLELSWRAYVPHATDGAELNPVVRMRHRCQTQPAYGKVLVPGRLAAEPTAVLPQGSHQVRLDGATVPAQPHPCAEVAHFPFRSAGQMLSKIVINSLQYRVMGGHADNDKGPRYREAYARLKRDPAGLLASVQEQSAGYGSDRLADACGELELEPLNYLGGPLAYTEPLDETYGGWLSLLHYAEDLALRYATLADERPQEAESQKRVDIVTTMRRQLDSLLTQCDQKERCIQQQHWDLLRLHEQIRLLREKRKRLALKAALGTPWRWLRGRAA